MKRALSEVVGGHGDIIIPKHDMHLAGLRSRCYNSSERGQCGVIYIIMSSTPTTNH